MTKADDFYKAMLARDYRFDGKFFVGVKTTGIYCRPICPAKPKRENVEFFSSSPLAEKSGYRPCLRCRPESAPLSPAWLGKSALVQRALREIATKGFINNNEDRFAEQFGVTARHLRRLFKDEVGQTPKQIAFNNRLNFARKLITESQLPLTTVAQTAGFQSIRRFNDAFKKRFKRAPTGLRKKMKTTDAGLALTLSYRPPFDWPSLLSFHRYHLIEGLEEISETTYKRRFKINGHEGSVEVSNNEASAELIVQVEADPSVLFAVTQRVRQMFDLDSDPLLIANAFRVDPFMNSLARKFPGLRMARGWDALETAVGAILGQVVSLAQARALMAQLIANYGDDGFFPSVETLALSDLSQVRTSEAKRAAVRELARLVMNKNLNLELPQDPSIPRKALLGLKGVGAWTAEYVSLRALGDADAFPGTDLILKRALAKHPDLKIEKLRPWRSYAAVYLWRQYAVELSKQKGVRK